MLIICSRYNVPMRENIRKFMLLTILYGLMASSGCKLDVPEGENPTFYLLKKAWPGKPTMDRKELLVSLASEDADLRRHGVMMFGNKKYAEFETTPELLANVALTDTDALVRATAVQALSSFHNYPDIINVYKKTAGDENPLVRQTTMEELRLFRSHKETLSILVERIEDDLEPDVKGPAAEILGFYRDRNALNALLVGLGDDDFQVSYLSKQSLQRLTGQDFGYDGQAWRQWIEEQNDPFAIFAGEYD